MSFPLTLHPRRPEPGAFARVLRRSRRWATFAVLLAMLTVPVPDSGQLPARFSLIKLDQVHGMDAADNTVWILALGSDARPGEPYLGSRSDAIQLVGINTKNHHAVTIGIPRDSYVDIPGHGRNKINSAMSSAGRRSPPRRSATWSGSSPTTSSRPASPA